MKTRACPTSSALSDWLAGRAPDAGEGPIAAHLDACPSCRDAAAAIESTGEPLLHGLKGLKFAEAADALALPAVLAVRLRSLPVGAAIDEAAPPVPRRLRDYELLEPIGVGGMGRVYKARHRRLGRIFAVKLLPSRAKDRVERFRRELAAHGPLDHPNVVRATDAGEAGGVMFLAMDYVEGTDADRLVQARGPLPVADACDVARQAALGLHHLHEAGIVHRDVKPANLMVTPGGTVRLLDLGLASSEAGDGEDRLTRDGAVLGTPDYLAPEQARDPRSADRRADVYSLGCTLYHLLAGRPPFAGRGSVGKLLAHHDERPTPIEGLRPEVPGPLAAVVRRMTAKDPASRYATAADVAAALDPFCEGSTPRPRRRLGRVALLAAAIPAALLAAWGVQELVGRSGEGAGGPAAVAASASQEPAREEVDSRPESTPAAASPAAAATSAPEPDADSSRWLTSPPTEAGPPKTAVADAEETVASPAVGERPRRTLVGPVASLTGHTQPVVAIAFAPDGTRASSAGGHQFEPVIGWDLVKRRSAGEQRPGPTVDTAFLPSSSGRAALAVGYSLELWDLGGEKPAARMGHDSIVTCLAVASEAPSAASGTDRGRVTVWDLADERRVAELPLNQPITAVANSADGKVAAAATIDGNVHLWDVAADRIEHVFDGHRGSVVALAFSADGAKLWAGERFAPGRPGDNQRVLIYDLKTSATDRTLVIAEPGRLVSDVALHPAAGLALAGHDDGTVSVWNVATGAKLRHDKRHVGQVTSLAVSPDGKAALSGGNDAKLWLWNLAEQADD